MILSTQGPAGETVGVFGGTFDPVHHGHLRAALEVLEGCHLSRLHLVPVGEPPHRQRPVASAGQRLRMLQAAVAGDPRLVADDRELRRSGPSYTVDTLTELRAAAPQDRWCLVLGADAFGGLPGWHRWRELLRLAHIVVMQRPGAVLAAQGEMAQLLAERRCADAADLHRLAAGCIHVQAITQLDISSSAIRALLARGGDPRYLVPDSVRDLLTGSGCYRQTAEVQARA